MCHLKNFNMLIIVSDVFVCLHSWVEGIFKNKGKINYIHLYLAADQAERLKGDQSKNIKHILPHSKCHTEPNILKLQMTDT